MLCKTWIANSNSRAVNYFDWIIYISKYHLLQLCGLFYTLITLFCIIGRDDWVSEQEQRTK